MKEILWIQPVFKEMIWGGNRLRTEYGYDIPGDHTGECWAVSAHQNGDCMVRSTHFSGKTLHTLWNEHRELFGNRTEKEFPLLVKLIDAKQDLSIQVHPDDAYAAAHENGALGKTECWYILDCEANGTIIMGHHAKESKQLQEMITEGRWEELLCERKIHKGDFFQIAPGTVHAIKAGTLLLEVQQSSDITYRLYDYDRLQNGKKRPLHLQQSMEVISCPQEIQPVITQKKQGKEVQEEMLICCPYYQVKKIDLQGMIQMQQEEDFLIISVLDGEGMIDGQKLRKGMHFLLPSGYGTYQIEGTLSMIWVNCPKQKEKME